MTKSFQEPGINRLNDPWVRFIQTGNGWSFKPSTHRSLKRLCHLDGCVSQTVDTMSFKRSGYFNGHGHFDGCNMPVQETSNTIRTITNRLLSTKNIFICNSWEWNGHSYCFRTMAKICSLSFLTGSQSNIDIIWDHVHLGMHRTDGKTNGIFDTAVRIKEGRNE